MFVIFTVLITRVGTLQCLLVRCIHQDTKVLLNIHPKQFHAANL